MLTKDTIKTDCGKNFGLHKSKDSNILYHKYNKVVLKMLVNKMPKEEVSVVDYGGANSILGKDLLKMKKNVKIENIDLDNTKFVEIKGIKNIKADITKYKPKKKYDFAMSRYTLHYLSKTEQQAFMKTAYNNLKNGGYFLLIMFITVGDDFKIKSEIELELNKLMAIDKEMFNLNSYFNVILKSKFEIIDTEKIDYELKIDDFYKYRFNLNKDQLNELKKRVGKDRFTESMVAVLLKK